MIDIEQKDYYSFDFYKSLSVNDILLAQEVEKSKGMVLDVMFNLGFTPQKSFFENHFTQYCIPFAGKLYPQAVLEQFIESDRKIRELDELSVEYTLRKALEKHSLSELKADTKILAEIFVNFKPSSKNINGDLLLYDYSIKVAGFISVFKEFFTNLNDMEDFFDKDFFDYIFLNIKNEDNVLWINEIKTLEGNVFVFALKSYLLDMALHGWHKNNLKARRLYAKLSILLAEKQAFMVEPKFNHRIVPDLLKTETLDIVCDNITFLIENSNHVYVKGLATRALSVNLIISLVYYLKMQSGNSSSFSSLVAQTLSDSFAKVDNATVKKIVDLLNYPSRKDSNTFQEETNLIDPNDIECNVFNAFDVFMNSISAKMLYRLNYKCLEKYIMHIPSSWGHEHVRSLERMMGEKRFCRYIQNKMLDVNTLFSFSPQVIAFMFNRSSLVEVMISKFSNDLEKIFKDTLLWTKISNIHEFENTSMNEFKEITTDVVIIEGFKKGFFKQEVSRITVERMANVYLNLRDYESFYLIVAGIKKHGHSFNIIISPWKSHLKNMPVTDLFENSKNKCFVKSMYYITQEHKLSFYGVKKKDAKNILKELSVFFLDKSIPLSWLPSADLSWNEQKDAVPGILLTQYDKRLNKNIENKLGVREFKEMVENYFDGFILEGKINDEIYTKSWKLNHLFVNQHLKNYRKNLPLLLKELESRPEYYALVALNSHPEVSGTIVNRLKFMVKMKTKDLIAMNIKDLLALNFKSRYNLVEEHFLFLKHEVNVDWEICFKGMLRLVKNVFWIAQSRDVDIKSKHISSLVVNTFLNFKAIYSFEVGIEQNTNVNYAYLLEPSFFQIIQESLLAIKEDPNKAINNSINEKGKDNFITALLRHIKYDLGNSDDVLNKLVFDFLETIQEKGFSWEITKDNGFIKNYTQNAIESAFKVDNPIIRSFEGYLMSLQSRYPGAEEFYKPYRDISDMNLIGIFLRQFDDGGLEKSTENSISLIKKVCIKKELETNQDLQLNFENTADFKI